MTVSDVHSEPTLRARKPLGINWIGMYAIVRREVTDSMRHPTQMLAAPWISAFVFIFVFGYVIGNRMPHIAGRPYLAFLMPGIVMMDVVTVAFTQASADLYFARFQRYVQEMLISPLSYFEMMAGSLGVAVLRSIVTAAGVLVMGAAFGGLTIIDVPAFLFWIVSVSLIFGLLGLVVGLWADNFEQLGALPIFLISPLSMVGGVFNTVAMLPPWLRILAYGNPFFYFINGLRSAMIGFHEGPPLLGVGLTLGLLVALAAIVWRLFATGWGLRE
jgi:ABC-2 type transport system permease protein